MLFLMKFTAEFTGTSFKNIFQAALCFLSSLSSNTSKLLAFKMIAVTLTSSFSPLLTFMEMSAVD